MGILSKAWKGIKKTVKKVAKGVKKLAKKVAYALPLGKKLWKLGGKIGTKIMEGIGKVTSALGPVGMIALSVLAPYAAPLWSAFGAASTAAAASGSIWGTIGQAIYNGANWVGGTLSSMTQGISKGLSTLAEGGFKNLGTTLGKAGSQIAEGFTKAFSGEAGAAGIQEGLKAATNSAIEQAAGNSIFEQTKSKILGEAPKETLGQTLDKVGTNLESIQQTGNFPTQELNLSQTDFSVDNLAKTAADKFTPQTLETQASNIVLRTEGAKATGSSLLSKAGDVAKSLLAGQQPTLQTSPVGVGDVGGNRFYGDAFARGGVASAGGQFLTDQQRRALELSSQQLTRGFG